MSHPFDAARFELGIAAKDLDRRSEAEPFDSRSQKYLKESAESIRAALRFLEAGKGVGPIETIVHEGLCCVELTPELNALLSALPDKEGGK